MKFSILTPTLDRPEMLQRAIASVQAQTYSDWEHIVVDVGTRQAVVEPDPLKEPDRRRKVFRKPAEGPAVDFQYALNQATGDIVHPLSDDDELAPDALERVAAAIGRAEWLVAATEIRQPGHPPVYRGGSQGSVDMTLSTDFMLGGAVYWRKSLTDRVGGFDPVFDGAADYDLYRRFIRAATPVTISDVLYVYHDHPGTDSRVRRENQMWQAERIRAGR